MGRHNHLLSEPCKKSCPVFGVVRFCQKCQEEIVNAYGERMREEKIHAWIGSQFVPESECQFWAHQALRKEQLARRVWPI